MTGYAEIIGSLPFVIKKSGTYTFEANLRYSGSSGTEALTVEVSNVVIDLSGYTLSGDSTTTGISAANPIKNLTIENGIISGFGTAISLTNAGLFVVQNLKLLNQQFGTTATDCNFGAVQNCLIVGRGTSATGINLQNCFGTVVKSNQIASCSYGCLAQDTAGNLFIGNQLENCATGLGLSRVDKYEANLTIGTTVPFNGGISVGNDNN